MLILRGQLTDGDGYVSRLLVLIRDNPQSDRIAGLFDGDSALQVGGIRDRLSIFIDDHVSRHEAASGGGASRFHLVNENSLIDAEVLRQSGSIF